MGLRKAGAIWVEGDRFFGREVELQVLAERVGNGTHTLLTAPRRMGKTSLVRELLRRLAAEGRFDTIFVDLEDVGTLADAIAEIVARSGSVRSAWSRSLDLEPWDEETALACLAALAETSEIDLPLAVRRDMCRRLPRLVPHDVQRFFECVEVHLRRFRRREASLEDVEQVYANEMFSVRGQPDMNHYESRLKVLLGAKGG